MGQDFFMVSIPCYSIHFAFRVLMRVSHCQCACSFYICPYTYKEYLIFSFIYLFHLKGSKTEAEASPV